MNNDIRYGRKRKGIKKQIKAKIDDWLSALDNAELETLIRKNLILTGGSIASMLLGEKVNDYDFYFKTKEATEAVARHYVDKFNAANQLNSVNDYTPQVQVSEDRVRIFLESAGVAGEAQSEYDYFETMGEDAAVEFAESLATEKDSGERYRTSFLSENAISLTDQVQIIVRFYGSPEEIHGNYDFQHAMCYYDLHEDNLVLPAEALECLLSRSLVYRGSLYPIASIFRMKKFLSRGWRITAGQQLKIMWQISELDLTDYNVLREQLTGVDMAYMFELIEALKDVEKSNIDSAYIATIIDRIFD